MDVISSAFLPGATVNAYAKSTNPSAAPNDYTGASLGQATVDADGSVTITGLEYGTQYVLTDGTKRVLVSKSRGAGRVYGGDIYLDSEEPEGRDGDAWWNTAA